MCALQSLLRVGQLRDVGPRLRHLLLEDHECLLLRRHGCHGADLLRSSRIPRVGSQLRWLTLLRYHVEWIGKYSMARQAVGGLGTVALSATENSRVRNLSRYGHNAERLYKCSAVLHVCASCPRTNMPLTACRNPRPYTNAYVHTYIHCIHTYIHAHIQT